MSESQPGSPITAQLARASAGDPSALAGVFPLVYAELHRLAGRQLRGEGAGHTLSPTALVHEAYMRLVDYSRMEWSGRAHFLAVAATAMRRILVEHARRRRSARRGGGRRRLSLDEVEVGVEQPAERVLELDEALTRLRELDARQARVVECRFFGGMTEEETAAALGVGLRTVKRDWAKARSWLQHEIAPEPPRGAGGTSSPPLEAR